MKKSIFFWLYFIVSIVLATYFAIRIITSNMGRGPVSTIKHVRIINNSKDFNLAEIKTAIGISEAKPIPIRSANLPIRNNRILEVPGVEKAATRLLPNGNLVIKIQKYNVVALWSDGVDYYPLSADGTKIDTPLPERSENTLVFKGNRPDELKNIDLTKIIDEVSPLSKYIDYMTFIESRRWNIHTKNGITIYLPEDNPSVAINTLTELNQAHKLLSRKLKIIDMRNSKKILVKLAK